MRQRLKVRRPNQRDIASRAGVSQSIVSHVVNDNQAVSISLETRARVLAAMDELGYVPNRSARALRLQRTSMIAALIPDITNPYYPTFVRGIQDVLRGHHLDLVTYNTDGVAELERQGIAAARRGSFDAMIAVGFHVQLEDFQPLLHEGVPVAFHGEFSVHPSERDIPLDFVFMDGVTAGKKATHYLIDKGHSRVAMIAGLEATPPRESRLQGFRTTLADSTLDHEDMLIFGGDFTEQGGYDAMQEVLSLDPRPTAVFAANDLMAFGALLACRQHGIRVPQDMSIVGFDDIPAARITTPALTTIRQDASLAGRRCAELVLDRLSGRYQGKIRRIEIPSSLVLRDSA